jgi:hypothetical protein
MSRPRRRPGPVLAALIIAVLAVFAAAALRPYEYAGDRGLLRDSDAVRVERDRLGLAFVPVGERKGTALAFFPDAKVKPEAYAYLGQACAAHGFPAFILAAPLDLAPLAPGKAAAAAIARPEVARWVLGGHGLGGEVAWSQTNKRRSGPHGLVLLAAAPSGPDLSGWDRPVVCLYGTKDPLVGSGKASRARRLMPPRTRYVEIAGGNHAQFGDFGAQEGDAAAVVSGPAQRRAAAEEALGLLELVDAGARDSGHDNPFQSAPARGADAGARDSGHDNPFQSAPARRAVAGARDSGHDNPFQSAPARRAVARTRDSGHDNPFQSAPARRAVAGTGK